MIKQLGVAVAAAVALCANTAFAVPLYDQNITPDVIFGSGNANGAWTVETAGNTELGLRAKVRGANVFNSNGDGSYNHESGFSSGTAAKWNFEFSINLKADGVSIRDPVVALFMQIAVTTASGTTSTPLFDPLAVWDDNAYGTNATSNGAGADDLATNLDRGVTDGYYVIQNSQNVGWMGLGIDLTAPAIFDISLWAFLADPLSGQVSPAGTSITVRVDGGGASVPEPAVLGLLGFGILGLRVAHRRRKA